MRTKLYAALQEAASASKIHPEMLNELKMCEQGLSSLTNVIGVNESYLIAMSWWDKPLDERVKIFDRLI